MKILLKNANILSFSEKYGTIDNGYLCINNDEIVDIGPGQAPADFTPDKMIDAQGKLVMPGLVNAHMHCYSTFARGIDLGASPSSFPEILEQLWWKLDKKLTTADLYPSTITVAMEGIRCGITTLIDHHASPNCIPGCLDELQHALSDINMRSILCYETSDRDGKDICNQGIEENARFIKKTKGNSLSKGTFGLHASFTVDDDTLEKSVGIAKELGVGVHLHVAEGKSDQDITLQKYKKRVVKRLYDAGALGQKSIAAHTIWVDQAEKEMLSETKTWCVHNPRSNMNNAVGAMDLLDLISRNANIVMGSDGMAASIWPEIRTAALIHKHEKKDPRVVWQEIWTMLHNNYRLANMFYAKPLGRLEPGTLADVVIFDYLAPTPLNSDNFLGHFLFGFAHVRAKTVIINGKLVLEDDNFVAVDEEKIMADSRAQASSFWKRFHS